MQTYTREQAKAEAAKRGMKYRITKDNEVHFYGQLPNSTAVGWWLAGVTAGHPFAS